MKVGDLVVAYSSLQGLILDCLEDDFWGKTANIFCFADGRVFEVEYKDLELISESR